MILNLTKTIGFVIILNANENHFQQEVNLQLIKQIYIKIFEEKRKEGYFFLLINGGDYLENKQKLQIAYKV